MYVDAQEEEYEEAAAVQQELRVLQQKRDIAELWDEVALLPSFVCRSLPPSLAPSLALATTLPLPSSAHTAWLLCIRKGNATLPTLRCLSRSTSQALLRDKLL